ncbi:MAG: linear amide C-N hydrolase [Fimbriimonadaceae bacterium]
MCTNFRNKTAKDGSVVVGRTLEFPAVVDWSLSVLPSDYHGEAQIPAGSTVKPRTWDAKYGIVGVAGFGKPNILVDGINTAGISVHLHWMGGGYCTFQEYKGDGTDIAETDLAAFLLGTCSSIAEIREAMKTVNVWGFDPGMGFVPPCHILAHDVTGSLAIEFHPEGHRVLDNPLGVGTNAPYLEWHLVNVRNYVGLSPFDPPTADVLGQKINVMGHGLGLRGLPGDYSPPSRFIQALLMVATSKQPEDGEDSERLAMHIANHFDIVPGMVREVAPDGSELCEVTDWTAVCNLNAKRYAYRTLDNPTTFVIELEKTDFTKAARLADFPTAAAFTPVTI